MPRYLYWVPVVFYMGVIFYFSSKTGGQVALPTPDYVAHGTEYFGLSWLVRWAWSGSRAGRPEQGCRVAILFCFIYGISDEFHQSFVPGRTPDAVDLLADTAGAALAQAVWYGWRRV
ncbi:MAG: VanZ family protein [Clostridia bacterium]|nr:VanZ family protein [Clostridia bacterium]